MLTVCSIARDPFPHLLGAGCDIGGCITIRLLTGCGIDYEEASVSDRVGVTAAVKVPGGLHILSLRGCGADL